MVFDTRSAYFSELVACVLNSCDTTYSSSTSQVIAPALMFRMLTPPSAAWLMKSEGSMRTT